MHTSALFKMGLLALAISLLLSVGWGASAFAGGDPTGRCFRLGFSTTPLADKTYPLLKNHGDLVSHSLVGSIPWPEALLSSDYRTYSYNLQNFWGELREIDAKNIPGHVKYVVVSPIESRQFKTLALYWGEQPEMPLPPPWDKYEFNHPNVKKAYTNYLIAVVKFFRPKYLAINMEANILLANAPLRWNAFKELNKHAYNTLKRNFPNLIVLSSVQYEYFLGLHGRSSELEQMKSQYPNVLQNEVRLLLQDADLMGLSTFPYMVWRNVVGPIYYEPALALAKALHKPIAIEQTGYISQDFVYPPLSIVLPGSEALQDEFVGFLLYLAWFHNFDFVVNFVAVDYKPNYDLESNVWSTTGMLTWDGRAKRVLTTWDNVLKIKYRTGCKF
jgi:hypothetical protein